MNIVIKYINIHCLVFGCADLLVPDFGWYKRDGDSAVIGCEHQERTWHLKCNDSQWIGVVGNCSQPSKSCALLILIIMEIPSV